MIDRTKEKLLRVKAVPKTLPEKEGKRIHESTIRRWASHGCRGILLESIMLGNDLYTSEQALERFFERLNRQRIHQPAITGDGAGTRSPAERRRAADKAGADLAKMGC